MKKHRYVLLKGNIDGLLDTYKELFGKIVFYKSNIKIIKIKNFYLVRIHRNYIPHFFISLLYYKVKGFETHALRVSGTIKSIIKKEKILK